MTNYTYRAEWSDGYCQYVGLCLEFKGRFAVALTPHEAIERVERMIAQELDELADLGMDPPPSLTDHRYSGNFAVRTSRVLHERLIIEATEQGVSLNQWVSYKLAGRPVPNPLDELFL
ncbi:toxin-antitoxin system HicB family antitoxin [Mycobacterium sp. RTGN5]|uniref:toxin-antitoxin system HicB family antitoxin n=1 Tax=Mycobacterium sp. RTGN5 TaxID=3016522 RepID=UPI0029C889E4|nr:toxin-antitoxin system HicB family antitoxin [Mycobacterium sp. RTGN5]